MVTAGAHTRRRARERSERGEPFSWAQAGAASAAPPTPAPRLRQATWPSCSSRPEARADHGRHLRTPSCAPGRRLDTCPSIGSSRTRADAYGRPEPRDSRRRRAVPSHRQAGRRGTRQTMPPAGRRDYMQTPEIRSQVRPALSHSLFVVYERGEAPGYDVSYDSWLAQPAMNPATTRTKARVFMGSPPHKRHPAPAGSRQEVAPSARDSQARRGETQPPRPGSS